MRGGPGLHLRPGSHGGHLGADRDPGWTRGPGCCSWTSATFPDRFYVVRNGKLIATLDPVYTFVSGTSHSWMDETPSPKRLLTYVVQRVVNNVASRSNRRRP